MRIASVATGLNEAKAKAAKLKLSSESGKPLDIPVSDIQENPNNPRTEFEPVALQELADDIKQSGVISPVSVFKSAAGADKPYTLNYGARRLRASVIAKQTTIPAFVTIELDAYQRVSENEQRAGLAPLELAEFIQDRLNNHGESQKQIAKRLGKPESIISDHMKLLKLDGPVKAAFERGQIAAARAAVDLSNLLAAASDSGKIAITERLNSDEPVTRKAVDELKGTVKTKGKKGANSSGRIATKKGAAKSKVIAQAVTEKQAESIRYTLPIFHVAMKRRKGVIVHDRDPNDPTRAWVLFSDKPQQIEQVKFRELTPHMFEPSPSKSTESST